MLRLYSFANKCNKKDHHRIGTIYKNTQKGEKKQDSARGKNIIDLAKTLTNELQNDKGNLRLKGSKRNCCRAVHRPLY